MRLKEGTLLFEVLVTLDRLFNILTGGSMGVTFSTRSYIQSVHAPTRRQKKWWRRIRRAIDAVFWVDHCKLSWEWELELKQKCVD